MYKKFIWLFVFLGVCQFAYADTCPTLKTIKSTPLTTWKAYDSDDHIQLTAEQTKTFINSIDQFSLAEWVQEGSEKGSIHCYYSDKNGSVLEAYLAKTSYVPENSKNRWYEVSGSMHCAAAQEECLFNLDKKFVATK
jgi:hypothetical protein